MGRSGASVLTPIEMAQPEQLSEQLSDSGHADSVAQQPSSPNADGEATVDGGTADGTVNALHIVEAPLATIAVDEGEGEGVEEPVVEHRRPFVHSHRMMNDLHVVEQTLATASVALGRWRSGAARSGSRTAREATAVCTA